LNFSKITGIPINDYEHIPEHIRIDRMTTDAAVRNSFLRSINLEPDQFKLCKGEACIMIGSSSEIATELGTLQSIITDYARIGRVFNKEFTITKVE